LVVLGWAAAEGSAARADDGPVRAEVVLTGGTLIDGTGAPRKNADVAIG